MKVSVAVLSCLMLVTALGSQAQVTNDAETEFMSKLLLKNPVVLSMLSRRKIGPQMTLSLAAGFHLATDCCISYISQSIPCSLMESYFETSSECSKPGVIFLTKKGRQVCAKPSGPGVQNCMKKLKS
nr:C-C motif chemokine 15 isoform X4 [Chlorocebus sabaeus]